MVHLDFRDARPIYAQIVDGVRQQISAGILLQGEKLPSVREFATTAAVNPNTMQKALCELENMGLVSTQRTAGRFVTSDTGIINSVGYKKLRQLTAEYMQKLNTLGYSSKDAIEIIQEHEKEAAENGIQ